MATKVTPEFTLGLTDEQQDFAIEYIDQARNRDPERVQAGVEVERHGCGEALLYIVDTDEEERIDEETFTPDELRDFTTEVGQFWYDRGRLEEPEMNALHYLQLIADYADGNVTKADIEDLQEDFEDDHGFVRSGLHSLRFRKGPDEEER